ncbi:MAG: hypothetical protein Q9168_001149 [Polycauliona sp. 1 TL-2023]
MAPFRRGKSGTGNYHSGVRRNASAIGGSGRRGGLRNSSASKGTSKNNFSSSRVQELADDRSESPDSLPEIGSPGSQSDAPLSNDETSESDEFHENPYSLLLQTLNPGVSHKEPGNKRRKLTSDTQLRSAHAPPSGDLDAVDDIDDGGDISDQGSADGSDIVTSKQERDSFSRHFADTDEDETLLRIQAVQKNQWTTEKITKSASWSTTLRRPIIPGEGTHEETNVFDVQNLKVKPKLESFAKELLSDTDDLTAQLAASMFSYRDVLYSARTQDNADTLRTLTSLHILNHISRTRDTVLRNNAKLSNCSDGDDLEVRDQGFTRPKVLILLPTRQSCVKMVAAMMKVGKPEQQGNVKRFEESYANSDDELSPNKPEDFRDLFGGNDDDMFRLGLKFARRTVKFFSQFYSSDIIIASPLGLRTVLGGDGKKKADHDFLSSIEMIVLDQSEALLMQNWEHVEYIFDHLNLQPKEAHGCDFSRVRSWYLDGHAKHVRQTILFSSFNFPALNKLYTQYMLNIAGKLKFAMLHKGAMMDLAMSVGQTYSRFDFTDPSSEPDDRFNYFSTAVLPSLIKASSRNAGGQPGILIFTPLYADFVRVRNHLAASSSTQHVSFGSLSEYTPVKEVARARSHLLSGRHSMLLYTERAHHFRRYRLKGINRIVFYGLPENPRFYKEMVSGLMDSSISPSDTKQRHTSVRCLFSKLDLLKLERIVGTQRYMSLLSDRGDTFDFI